MVGFGPFGPLEFDSGAGGNGSVELAGGCTFVADDVWVGEITRVDESSIFIFRDRPSGHVGVAGGVGIVDGVAGITQECQYGVWKVLIWERTYYTPPASMPETLPWAETVEREARRAARAASLKGDMVEGYIQSVEMELKGRVCV